MELSGPFKDSKILEFIPGPGKYKADYSTLDQHGMSLRQRLPDVSTKHLLKVYL